MFNTEDREKTAMAFCQNLKETNKYYLNKMTKLGLGHFYSSDCLCVKIPSLCLIVAFPRVVTNTGPGGFMVGST